MVFPTYESDQIISLLRGKRPVLPVVKEVIARTAREIGAKTFLDPFTGSGIVSRVARQLDLTVSANDCEPFACVSASVYLSLSREDLLEMFPAQGGVDAYYSFINLHGLYAFHSGKVEGEAYLSRLYAPEDPRHPQVGKERLYYTPENARFLDAVRTEVENSWMAGTMSSAERAVILSSILYQGSLRANVSGTFTSYHKKFYRSGKAVRSRIVDPVELLIPALTGKKHPPGRVYQEDAIGFCRRMSGDICFLDPPSSPQQYGSAYHLLNTLALWDDPLVDNAAESDGSLVDRGGIRQDWKERRSPFCSRKDAYGAFYSLLNAVDAPRLILTYPDNGMVHIDQILAMLKGKYRHVTLSVLPKEHRGGRQNRGKAPVEHLFIAGDSPSFYQSSADGLEKIGLVGEIEGLRKRIFKGGEKDLRGFTFIAGILTDAHPDYSDYVDYTEEELQKIAQTLRDEMIEDTSEALLHLLDHYKRSFDALSGNERVRLEKKAISLLRFLHGYEKEAFRAILTPMERFMSDNSELLSHRLTFSDQVEGLIHLDDRQGKHE